MHKDFIMPSRGIAIFIHPIGAAEQIVHNNNNKLITHQGESRTKLKKVKKSFEKVL